jgi:hypothetical protein
MLLLVVKVQKRVPAKKKFHPIKHKKRAVALMKIQKIKTTRVVAANAGIPVAVVHQLALLHR